MQTTLHPCVAALAALTENDNARFPGTSCVRVFAEPGRYRAEASNGMVAGIISGTNTIDYEESPDPTPHVTAVLVPEAFFGRLFPKKKEPATLVARTEFTLQGKQGTTSVEAQYFHATGDTTSAHDPKHDTLRFPNINQILTVNSTAPRMTVHLDPDLLIDMLKAAKAVMQGSESKRVTLHFWAPDKPFAVVAHPPEGGVFFDGVMMPFSPIK